VGASSILIMFALNSFFVTKYARFALDGWPIHSSEARTAFLPPTHAAIRPRHEWGTQKLSLAPKNCHYCGVFTRWRLVYLMYIEAINRVHAVLSIRWRALDAA
jgi:hypothetical protein